MRKKYDDEEVDNGPFRDLNILDLNNLDEADLLEEQPDEAVTDRIDTENIQEVLAESAKEFVRSSAAKEPSEGASQEIPETAAKEFSGSAAQEASKGAAQETFKGVSQEFMGAAEQESFETDEQELSETDEQEPLTPAEELLRSAQELLKASQEEQSESEVESEDEEKKKEESKSVSFLQELLSWVIPILAAVLIALVLKNYVIINATVPTGSMLDTIQEGDNLIGFRLAYTFSEPERGDIIIFYYPDDESKKFIKRVIGLPGDTVVIQDAKIYINGSEEPLEEDYLREEWTEMAGPFVYEVPEDSYLVLGDNRNNSKDSRYWTNTYVTKDKIIGKALFVYYPFSDIKWLG